jgi:hypothetical protein
MTQPPPQVEVDQLRLVVATLREELAGMRTALQTRAVIEQAKGVLIAERELSLDEAFEHLRALSQQHNVKLVEVAATIVGMALPDQDAAPAAVAEAAVRRRVPRSSATSPQWQILRQERNVRTGAISALLDAMAGAPDQGDDAADLIRDVLHPHVDGVVLYRCQSDGSLRLQGSAGIPGDVVSAWRQLPPGGNPAQVPGVQDAVTVAGAGPDAGHDLGWVCVAWTAGTPPQEPTRQASLALARRLAATALRQSAPAEPELDWLDTVLAVLADPWLLLEVVPSQHGDVTDLVVQAAASHLPEAPSWLGRRVLELWPDLAGDAVLEAMRQLVHGGGMWAGQVERRTSAPWSAHPGTALRVVRLAPRLVLTWRPGGVDEQRQPALRVLLSR